MQSSVCGHLGSPSSPWADSLTWVFGILTFNVMCQLNSICMHVFTLFNYLHGSILVTSLISGGMCLKKEYYDLCRVSSSLPSMSSEKLIFFFCQALAAALVLYYTALYIQCCMLIQEYVHRVKVKWTTCTSSGFKWYDLVIKQLIMIEFEAVSYV